MDKREIALYICSDNGHTITETANKFNVSVSTIKKKLAEVRDKNRADYDAILAEKLKLTQDKIALEGQKKGGKTGKRSRVFNEEQARMYAEAYLSSGLTFDELSTLSKIPKSTLHEMIRSINDSELQHRISMHIKQKEKIIVSDKMQKEGFKWTR